MVNFNKLTVGYFALGDLNDFPAKIVNEIWDSGYSELASLSETLIKYPKLLNSFEEVNKAINFVNEKKPDIIVINLCSWVQAGIALRFFRETSQVLKILWCFGDRVETLPVTALLELTSTLSKFKNKFIHLVGNQKNPITIKRLKSILNVVSTIKHLKISKLGFIGYNCPGMVDATPDELALRRCTGAELVHLDLFEVFNEFKNVRDEECNSIVEQLKKDIGNIEVSNIHLISSIKLYVVLRKIVNKYDLSTITIRCWPELKGNTEGINATPCYALSRLTSEGIMGVCESDIASSVTMFILKSLSNNFPVVLDYNTIDMEKNHFTFWHCGAHAIELAEKLDSISIKYPSSGGLQETKAGMALEFSIKEGEATFAKITREFDKMLISKAQFITPSNSFRGGIGEANWETDVYEFLDKIIEEGFEHHICAVHGDLKYELKLICDLLNLRKVLF